ncbi:hypothetical protein EV361DRAFT_593894 [Lentinula raphanica]|nr:hypothetical protein EV361DRAFT_593894 [Lentinula raphanica]
MGRRNCKSLFFLSFLHLENRWADSSFFPFPLFPITLIAPPCAPCSSLNQKCFRLNGKTCCARCYQEHQECPLDDLRGKEAKGSREGKDLKEPKEAKEAKEVKEAKEAKEAKESREVKEVREPREPRVKKQKLAQKI